MSIFNPEEPPTPAKKCKFTSAGLMNSFSSCHTCGMRLSTSTSSLLESDSFNEHEAVVSEIRSRATEKLSRKPGLVTGSFSWVFCAATGEMYITSEGLEQKVREVDDHEKEEEEEEEEEESDELLSVKSCFTMSSTDGREEFFSVKSKFSLSSSFKGIDFKQLKGIDFEDYSRRLSILKELCHCKGWPFGLCRKALLRPPMPKSPSDSWLWHRGNRPVKKTIVKNLE